MPPGPARLTIAPSEAGPSEPAPARPMPVWAAILIGAALGGVALAALVSAMRRRDAVPVPTPLDFSRFMPRQPTTVHQHEHHHPQPPLALTLETKLR